MSGAPGQEMPFLDHLEELRKRLFWIAGAVVLGVVVAFALLSKLDIIRLLERPILPLLHGQKLIYTHPGTSFHILLNASLVLGIILASPIIVAQLWGFLAPALYSHEKRVVVPVVLSMASLFLAGVSLSYFVVLPLTLQFLMSIESTALTPMISATEYFDFAISMCLAFGLVFEVPIAILALTALGIITPQFLSKYRRHAVVVCLTAAAFITPGADPYSLFALAIPLYILYEVSVFVAIIAYRKRQKRRDRLEAEELASGTAANTAEKTAAVPRSLYLLLIAMLLAPNASVFAQVGRPPAARTQTPRQRPDSARKDSTADSTRTKDLIKWLEADSVMKVLMARPGYSATRYQADQVVFDARTRLLNLRGKKAGVERDKTVLVGDSIVYNDSTKIIVARGDTVILRDPSRQAADVIARGRMSYNVALHRGCVTNISTSVESGQQWFVEGADACFVSDTTRFAADTTRGRETAFYARNASITSCDDSIPDYHFQAKEVKMVSKNIMVARPAVLYIGEVPIMWLPFIFQDMRSGRRSGVLTPRFGVSELFRNSPTYRRHVENIGYYFAFSDYMDAEFALDWRSGARSTVGDPGWVRLNGDMQYRWLNRFLSGRIGMFRHSLFDGTTNTGLSWQHSQSFSDATHLSANINYVTNTFVQRTTSFNPATVLASITSSASYDTKIGSAALSIGGTRSQHPGRGEVNQTFPTFSISSPTIQVTRWLDWTPTFNYQTHQDLNIDETGEFAYRFFTNATGAPDSLLRKRNARNSTSAFGTPLKIGGFSWNNSFALNSTEVDLPLTIVVVNPEDSSKKASRVFGKSFATNLDWQTSFGLPSLMHGSLNLSPSIGVENVDGSNGFWVRSQLSGGRFVHQSKRPSVNLSASPTLFALFPGFGPVTRFRHSITPIITFSYAPSGTLSTEFLQATNRSRQSFLGALARNQISLGLSHVLEAKLKSTDTSSTAEPRKIKILSMNFSSLAYDLERARKTHRSGFSTPNFSTDFYSDLIPSFRASVGYSLYQGDIMSDSARFKPFRETINASFNVNAQSGIFAALTRVFGKAVPERNPSMERPEQTTQDALANRVAATPVAGVSQRDRQYSVPTTTQGWEANFNYSSSRQRPPTGSGVIIEQDITTQCAPLRANPIVYQQCLEQAAAAASSAVPVTNGIVGAPFVRTPPRDNLQSQMTFHLTPKWAGSWGTNYDFQARKFGSHNVSLQRDLHDWRAIFGFTQAPNGNFAFSFFISLKAEPDLKFNYDKSTYRSVSP
ncbi:MAG: twin-arginine translocase subunit TatC [Gemmatimonadota bacterium]|nr:twin-arginine translocase subunit TatC [Gemmatimonadota bacterium]